MEIMMEVVAGAVVAMVSFALGCLLTNAEWERRWPGD